MIRSLYIGLTLPDDLARRFPHDARRGAPHVTVLYCADVETSPDDVMNAITNAVAGMGSIPIVLSDEVIQLGPDDAPVAAVTIDDDLRLRLLRLAIRAELDARSIAHPQTFAGYDPHATIRGLAEGETVEGVKPPGGSCSIDVLTVRIDNVEHLVTMGPARAALTSGVPTGMVELRSMRWGQDLQAEADARAVGVELPAGWILGRPFRCLAVGEIYQRVNSSRVDGGEMRGQPITVEHLQSIVRVFDSGEAIPVNREHRRDCPEGDVIACWLVDGGQSLAVLCAYAPDMAAYVARSSGALWSSPEISWDTAHDAATGEVLGSMLMDGLAVCAHPAQAHRKLDRVRLGAEPATERAEMMPDDTEEPTVDEEMKQFMATVMAAIEEMKAEIAALKGAEEGEGSDETEGSDGTDPQPEQNEEMATLRAEIASLKADAAKIKAEKLSSERAAAVRELLSTGRIEPAEKAAAEAVVNRGGVELLSTVYGGRKPGHAVPSRKSHDQKVDVPTGDESGSAAHKAITEYLSSDEGKGHTYLSAAAHIESKRPDLFAG